MRKTNKIILMITVLLSICLFFHVSSTHANEKYAVLVSAGFADLDENMLHAEFWYDLFLLYESLIGQGYTHDHIYVLYADGNDFDSRHPRYNVDNWHPEWPGQITDYNNHKDSIENIFHYLATGVQQDIPQIGTNDDLFVWWMGHGGAGFCDGDHGGKGAFDIEAPEYSYRMYDTELQAHIDQITNYRTRFLAFAVCHSGAIIDNFKNDDTIILTSVPCNMLCYPSEYEILDSGSIPHMEFNYNLLCALNWSDPSGSVINPDADINDDLSITIDEIYLYTWENKVFDVDPCDYWYERWRSYPQFSDPNNLASDNNLLNTDRCIFVDTDAPLGGGGTSWEDAYKFIHTALDNANENDVILVADGTYDQTGAIDFNGKKLTLRSLKGPTKTIIYGDGSNPVVSFNSSSENKDAILEGFTITNGGNSGIHCSNNASPTILNCIVTENSNSDYWFGGGITCFSASPSIFNCIISNNTNEFSGGGIYCLYSNSKIANCSIYDNTASAGGGIDCLAFSPTIINCNIIGNFTTGWGGGILCDSTANMSKCTISENTAFSGGGIYCMSGASNITNCVITKNNATQASIYGGGGGIYCDMLTTPFITNCTIAQNKTAHPTGGGIFCCDLSSPTVINTILWGDQAAGSPNEIRLEPMASITITYSDIQGGGYEGAGNINEDPLFIDSNSWNYRLHLDSNCIDAGDPSSLILEDRDSISRPQDGDNNGEAICDIGAYEDFISITGSPYQVIRVYTVSPGGSIQKVIDAARDADTIVLQKGVYTENINFKGKKITLRSTNPDDPNIVSATIIDGNGTGSAVTFNSAEEGSKLVGITIRNGYGNKGGGIFIGENSFPHIQLCRIIDNVATYGGGIYCNVNSNPVIVNCEISNNSSSYGGGLYYYWSSGTILRCLISNNFSNYYGGGIMSYYFSTTTISNCTIIGNTSGTYGGGIWCFYSSTPLIVDCTINDNTAGHGGGIQCYSSSPTIKKCTIDSNEAYYSGGGIYCHESDPQITNCIISRNSASNGGGIRFRYGNTPVIKNCTITKNSASTGGGIDCYSSSPTITNCILWGDTAGGVPDEIHTSIGTPTVTYSDIQGGYGDPQITHNINEDPLFIDPNVGDYHLQEDSNCIDAGTANMAPDEDREGRVRPRGNGYDMGAYEFTGVSVMHIYPGSSIQGAIDDASDGDTIILHPGIHYEYIDFMGKAITLESIDPNDPNVVETTIIDGSLDPGTYLQGLIMFRNTEEIDSILQGVTIRQSFYLLENGGLIYCRYASPSITNCIIKDNQSTYSQTSGIYCEDNASPTITNCTISNNQSATYGAGICCKDNSSPTIMQCSIKDNTAGTDGGGIYCISYSAPQLIGCIFSGNKVITSSSDQQSRGGGIYCNDYASLIITDCIISGNETYNKGFSYGGGIYAGNTSSVNVINSSIIGNKALNISTLDYYPYALGGGIYCDSNMTITNCMISENSAGDLINTYKARAGGIYCSYSSSLSIDKSTIDLNFAKSGKTLSCQSFGGGIYVYVNPSLTINNSLITRNNAMSTKDSWGGGLYLDNSSSNITNCTFSKNNADNEGGAIYGWDSYLTIKNSILWSDTAGGSVDEIYNSDFNDVTVTYSDIQGGFPDPNNTNINLDPDFIDPNDPNSPDFHLDPNSPCIDSGTNNGAPATGKDGVIRPQDGNNDGTEICDMGAYEFEYPNYFKDDMENGLNGWTATGMWHQVSDSSCISPGYYSPTTSWYYGQDSTCNYNNGDRNFGYLISPEILDLPSGAKLTFRNWREVEFYYGPFDRTYVEVSTNGGSSWTIIWYKDSYDSSQSTWLYSGQISLDAYAGNSILIRFTFDTVDNEYNNYTGWFIDDVCIKY